MPFPWTICPRSAQNASFCTPCTPFLGLAKPALRFVFVLMMACQLLNANAAPATTSISTETGNQYYSGRDVVIQSNVPGDVYATGQHVTVNAPVANDAGLAGGTVDVRSDIGQDLRAAGGHVSVHDVVGGDLTVAGGTIEVPDTAVVYGSTMLAGGEVLVDGRFDHSVRIYANRIVVGGEIDGNADLYAREIVLRPSARIDGNLNYTSAEELPQEQRNQISGNVTRGETPARWNQKSFNATAGWFHPVFFLGMLIYGFVLHMLFPQATTRVATAILGAPLRSVGIGLVTLFGIPWLAVLLFITLIGFPLGFILVLLYPLLLTLGYLGAAFAIGRKLADLMRQPEALNRTRQVAFLAAALIILAVASAIPFLGSMLVFIALVAGVGGWTNRALDNYRNYRRRSGGPSLEQPV